MVVFKPNLPAGEIWERALKVKGATECLGERGTYILIIPPVPKAKITVTRKSAIIFCQTLGQLDFLKQWLSKQLQMEENMLGEPSNVMLVGAKPAYYLSLKEVEETLKRIEYPPEINADEFRDFVKVVFSKFCEGEKITIPPLVQSTGFSAEKVERFLDFMVRLKLMHMKPPKYQLEKIYFIGCTPKEEFNAVVEGISGKIAARAYYRRLRIFEILGIILKREPLLKIREGKPLLRILLERIMSLEDRPLLIERS